MATFIMCKLYFFLKLPTNLFLSHFYSKLKNVNAKAALMKLESIIKDR